MRKDLLGLLLGGQHAMMSDVEQDLERLLAGDQNVGGSVRGVPATAPPLRDPTGGRVWVWGAAMAALIVGVVMVLTRPEVIVEAPDRPTAPAISKKVAPGLTPATPPPMPMASTQRLPSPEARIPASTPIRPAGDESAASARRTDHAPRRGGNARIPSVRRESNRSAAAAATAAAGGEAAARAATNRPRATLPPPRRVTTTKSEDPVIRGVLPSRSGEGYPDN